MRFTDSPYELMMSQKPDERREPEPPAQFPKGHPCYGCSFGRGSPCMGICYRKLMKRGDKNNVSDSGKTGSRDVPVEGARSQKQA